MKLKPHKLLTVSALFLGLLTVSLMYLSNRRDATPGLHRPEFDLTKSRPLAGDVPDSVIANPIGEATTPATGNVSSKTEPGAMTRWDTGAIDRIPNEFILRFKDERTMAEFIQDASQLGMTVLDLLPEWNSIRLYAGDEQSLRDLAAAYGGKVEVARNYYVMTPDIIRHPTGEPRRSSGDYSRYVPFGNNAREWLGLDSTSGLTGEGVVIAVLDTGVADHPSIRSNIVKRIQLVDDAAAEAGDYGEHGTIVAMIIASQDPNSPGIAPGAEIISVQVLDSDGIGDLFTLARGIKRAVDEGATIINASLGTSGHSSILADAVDYADANGVLIVAASGNDGFDVTYPARYSDVIAVTAVDALGQHVDFANTGMANDFAAPGFGIRTAQSSDNQGMLFTGTSFSAPYVAATAALILDDHAGVREAVNKMANYSNDAGPPGWDAIFGTGIIDIGRILNADIPGIYDMAVAGHHIDTANSDDTHLSIIVSAQNRGTEIPARSMLEVAVNGQPIGGYEFDHVRVGETVSRRLSIPTRDIQVNGQSRIRTSIRIIDQHDSNIGNDDREFLIMVVSDPNEED